MSVSARRRRLQPWQVLTACLVAIVLALGLAGGGVLGVWQGLSENATNMVTAAAASAVAVHSVHCSGLSPAYPTTCTDAQGTVTISWTAVPGSTGITVQRATAPAGPYSTIATLAGSAITYTDSAATAAYNTQYYYEVYSGTPSWMPASDVDMALSLPPTGGTDDTIGTGGTAFTGPYTQSGTNLYAMATAGGTTYTYTDTTNWGAAATLLGGQSPDWMGCANPSQCWAYTYQGDIWASTNGGASWTEETTPSNPVWYGGWFLNASDGWATGANGTIVATTNGGTTWTAQTSGSTQELTAVDCVSTTQCWVSGFGGVILVSSNGGTTWTAQNSTTTNTLDEISCVSASDCWASGAAGTIIATTNGGATWTAQTSGSTQELYGISCVSTTQCWAAGGAGVILATSNGGTTWTAQTSGTTDALYAIQCYSATACWAGGNAGVIVASINGTTWGAQTSGTTYDVWGFDCLSALNCYAVGSSGVGGAGYLRETTNGGSTWFAPVATQYLQWTFTPTVASAAPVTSAVVTLVSDASAAPGTGATTYIEVSANSGATWSAFWIPNETTTMATQTVSVVSVINSATAVSGLELRYVVSNGSAYKSTFDLVHVDIN
jgi:photosystem II stability/assembly factor-like uncharacterized protein